MCKYKKVYIKEKRLKALPQAYSKWRRNLQTPKKRGFPKKGTSPFFYYIFMVKFLQQEEHP